MSTPINGHTSPVTCNFSRMKRSHWSGVGLLAQVLPQRRRTGCVLCRSLARIRTCAVSSEEFTNEFINSMRDGKSDTFRKRNRQMDILRVDDIQFLADRESSQEEFFHTFHTTVMMLTARFALMAERRTPSGHDSRTASRTAGRE